MSQKIGLSVVQHTQRDRNLNLKNPLNHLAGANWGLAFKKSHRTSSDKFESAHIHFHIVLKVRKKPKK